MPATRMETDYESITARIMIRFNDFIPTTLTDGQYAKLCDAIRKILRDEFSERLKTSERTKSNQRSFARRRAEELFGGHCNECKSHYLDPPCVSKNPKIYGCESFVPKEF